MSNFTKNLKNFFQGFASSTKSKIEALALTNLNNSEKKETLDNFVEDWATKALDKLPINVFIKMLIRKVVIENISTITQIIYDLIKSRVNGVTKKEVQ